MVDIEVWCFSQISFSGKLGFSVYCQYFALFSACKQQQAHPGPVADNRDGSEEVQRGPKRAALAERKVNQEYPQEFSVAKYVFLF